MTAQNQDFTTYIGDSCQPVVTVKRNNGSGTAIDVSTVQEIVWVASRDATSGPVLTKRKSLGGIKFVTDGKNGEIEIDILPADTAQLTGYYLQRVVITDAAGNVSTVTIGRMLVGIGPVWTYSGDPRSSDRDAVRYLIGDIIVADPQINDPELDFALSQCSSIYRAAAIACRSLAGRLSREADTVDKDLRDSISQRARAYSRMAVAYDEQAMTRGGGLPYAGGISVADKEFQQNDQDRVAPQYTLGMDDNLIDPEAPVGGETQQGSST